MTHEISVLGCGAIYIDNERVFGSKPYGLFSTVNWSATDEDLKRIADRCLEVIADHKTESNSEIPNNSTSSKMEQVDKDINVRSKDEPQTYITEDRDTQILDAWQVHHRSTTSVEDEPQTVDEDDIGDCNICKYVGSDKCDDCFCGSSWSRMTDCAWK